MFGVPRPTVVTLKVMLTLPLIFSFFLSGGGVNALSTSMVRVPPSTSTTSMMRMSNIRPTTTTMTSSSSSSSSLPSAQSHRSWLRRKWSASASASASASRLSLQPHLNNVPSFTANGNIGPTSSTLWQSSSTSSVDSSSSSPIICSEASKSNLFCTPNKGVGSRSGSGSALELSLSPKMKSTSDLFPSRNSRGQLKSLLALANLFEDACSCIQQDNVKMSNVELNGNENQKLNGECEHDNDDEHEHDNNDDESSFSFSSSIAVLEQQEKNEIERRRRELIQSFADSTDEGERAFSTLLDLDMVELHLDPDDDDVLGSGSGSGSNDNEEEENDDENEGGIDIISSKGIPPDNGGKDNDKDDNDDDDDSGTEHDDDKLEFENYEESDPGIDKKEDEGEEEEDNNHDEKEGDDNDGTTIPIEESNDDDDDDNDNDNDNDNGDDDDNDNVQESQTSQEAIVMLDEEELEQLSGVQRRKYELIKAYSHSEDLGERTFAMLLKLDMVEVHLDPDDPLYDDEWDFLYAPENRWIA